MIRQSRISRDEGKTLSWITGPKEANKKPQPRGKIMQGEDDFGEKEK